MICLERRLGIPREDIERVMQHYGVDYAKAERLIAEKGVPALIPPRGTRMQTNSPNWVLVATGIGTILTGLATIYIGMRGDSST